MPETMPKNENPATDKPAAKIQKTSNPAWPVVLSGVWAIEPMRFSQLRDEMRRYRADGMPSGPLPSDRPAIGDNEEDDDDEDKPYNVVGGIAQISISGVMTNERTLWQLLFGGGMTTPMIQAALAQADDDDSVLGVMLKLDTPGGSVDGVADLASQVAGMKKLTYAYAQNMCASAGYWVASQASKVLSNSTAMVGCIGTVIRLEDSSEFYESMGVKVHLASSGGMKGAGMDGTVITDEQLAYFKSIAEDLTDQFIAGVATGRKLSPAAAKALADGRIHVGAKAKDAGLVDGVASYGDAMKMLRNEIFFGSAL